jgi:hypothetical protein
LKIEKMMNSIRLYPARSYSASGSKGRGCLLGDGHRAQSRRSGVTPASEPEAKARGGLHLKHQWGGCDPLGMDRGVRAHQGGATPVGRRV